MTAIKDQSEATSIVRWAFDQYWPTSDWTTVQRASLAAALVGRDKFDAKDAIEAHWRSSGWKNPKSVSAILEGMARRRADREPAPHEVKVIDDPPDTVYVVGGFGAICSAMKANRNGDPSGVRSAFEHIQLRKKSGGERRLSGDEIESLARRLEGQGRTA